ncbi:MAG: Cna B-type domain-containing protein [Erysipelotrichaceae bacterium]|nr:Cna B-type domain-containing protein [Erysipelotrichaceae bacterium]
MRKTFHRIALIVMIACLAFSSWHASLSAEAMAGGFYVTGASESYRFDEENGVLYVSGDITVRTESETGNRIVIEDDATVTLNGIDINAVGGPAILIRSPHTAQLVLAQGTVNNVEGGSGNNINATSGAFAAIEVEFEFEHGEAPHNYMASLFISGEGTLNATAKSNAAAIGGSNALNQSVGRGLYGNIIIDSGTINAEAIGGGAGIGSSNNPAGGTSSGSYKQTENNNWGTITINGGTVNAVSTSTGAGIGGGNHVDSGTIVINGGTIYADGAVGIGSGLGSSKNSGNAGDKGPGYYYGNITINGGTITATSNDIGAGIGGAMYCDAIVTISGGTINATGGSRENNTHHGGAGIGGGYLGHGNVTITGGEITATGGDGASGIGSGGSPNSNELRGLNGRGEAAILEGTEVTIEGGTINAYGGPQGGSGIGLGTGGDKATITIKGGKVMAVGAPSSREAMQGGSGIGSGFYGLGTGSDKYFVMADVDISITGGDVTAIGGWGASGIGSGADNRRAASISISSAVSSENGAKAGGFNLEAYADGTKFAIDTRKVPEGAGKADDGGLAESDLTNRNIKGDFLQATYVFPYEYDDIQQGTEGLHSIKVIYDSSDEVDKTLTHMPDGYRSFATNVSKPGNYDVFTDDEQISNGKGRYFSFYKNENWQKPEIDEGNTIKYQVATDTLSDNMFLYPVKTIVVYKKVILEGNTTIEDVQVPEYRFAIQSKTTNEYITNADGGIWIETIPAENGYEVNPENDKEYFLYKAVFVNVQDDTYNIWEVDETGSRLPKSGAIQGKVILKDIATEHDGGSDNNGEIDQNQWNDVVGVLNTYEKPQVEVKVTKLWDDDDNANETRPDSIVVNLLADGVQIDSRTITADDGWQCVFTELDQYNEQSEEIVYDVEEEPIKGYQLISKTQDGKYSFTFTNACEDVPDTYDSGLTVWICLMMFSFYSFVAMALFRRKQALSR